MQSRGFASGAVLARSDFYGEAQSSGECWEGDLVKKFRPELVSPVWVKSRTFHGPARFDFFVYQLNF